MAACLLGLVVAFMAGEATLRVWDPFGFRNAGGDIRLPRLNKRVMRNREIAALDSVIVHTRNELGFRGEAYPKHPEQRFKIVAVGGSTTECFLLSDGEDWPAQLRSRLAVRFPDVWVNNAGLDGHTTRGHLVVLEKAVLPLRPEMVLLLVGVNDAAADRIGQFERNQILSDSRWGWDARSVKRLIARSRLLTLAENLANAARTRRTGITHLALDIRSIPQVELAEPEREALRVRHRAGQPEYEARLRELVRLCRAAGAEPVFLTQPALFGPAVDRETGVDLGSMRAIFGVPGELGWEVLELYNETTRRVGHEEGVLVMDLARRVEHTSAFFYDHVHFTPGGADKVAELVAEGLAPRIEELRRKP